MSREEFKVTDGAEAPANAWPPRDPAPPPVAAPEPVEIVTPDEAYRILEEQHGRPKDEIPYDQMVDLIAEHAAPQLQAVFKQLLGRRDDHVREETINGLMFWQCTEDHSGPVRSPDGRRQRSRVSARGLFLYVNKVWTAGTIYPFASYRQLPLAEDTVYKRDPKTGEVIFKPDPTQRNPMAKMIPDPITTVDSQGRQHKVKTVRMVDGVPVILFFERTHVSRDRVAMWLAGQKDVGIENPVNGAMLDGNYLDRIQQRDETDPDVLTRDLSVRSA